MEVSELFFAVSETTKHHFETQMPIKQGLIIILKTNFFI